MILTGVAYNLGPPGIQIYDALSDPSQCALDADLMQRLLVNTIRVYTVNSTLNHTECMNTFRDHGIYVIADLTTPLQSISQVGVMILCHPHKYSSSPSCYHANEDCNRVSHSGLWNSSKRTLLSSLISHDLIISLPSLLETKSLIRV